MSLYNVIIKPIATEKTSILEVLGDEKTYTVQVSPRATKVDIRTAFKRIYWVDVEKVNIINTREKFKMTNKWIAMKRKPTKKAYVTVKKWQVVDFLNIK